jgi:hypothetical protein
VLLQLGAEAVQDLDLPLLLRELLDRVLELALLGLELGVLALELVAVLL